MTIRRLMMLFILFMIATTCFPLTAFGQETAYALSTKCWEPVLSNDGLSYTFRLRQQLPAAKDCFDANGVVSKASVIETYTKPALDEKLAGLRTEIKKLSTQTITAVEKSVEANSVKGDQVDKMVVTLQEKLYDRILRQVKADLQATPTPRSAGRPQ